MGKFNQPVPDESATDCDKHAYILARMASDRLIYSNNISGSPKNEIALIENENNFTFPPMYRWFLENISQSHGSLTMEISVSLQECVEINREYRNNFREFSNDGDMVQLPDFGWIVSHRYGEQFQYIDCRLQPDSSVWYFNPWSTELKIIHTTIFQWIVGMMDACESAIELSLIHI